MDEYIEREAAYEDFERCNSENPKWTPSRVKTLIARQKAADVAPVRHGHWNAINQIATGLPWKYRCNDCGCPQEYTHNYCPNCGADMRGGNYE